MSEPKKSFLEDEIDAYIQALQHIKTAVVNDDFSAFGKDKDIGGFTNKSEHVLFYWAEHLWRTGRREEAIDKWRAYADRGQRIQAEACLRQGVLHRGWMELDEAEEQLRKALRIMDELEDKDGVAAALDQLGIVYRVKKQDDRAEKSFHDAIEIYKTTKNKRGIAEAYNHWAGLKMQNNRYRAAISKHNLGIESAQGFADSLATLYANRGIAYLRDGRPKACIGDLEEAERLEKKLNRERQRANLDYYFGDYYYHTEDFTEAVARLEKAKAAFARLGLSYNLERAGILLDKAIAAREGRAVTT